MKQNNYGHWSTQYCDEFESDDHFGFIYLVVNKMTGKKYIGRKQFRHVIKKPPLKGRKNKRHVKKESNWRTYTTSSVHVNNDIVKYGIDNFSFDILQLHDSKGALHYGEVQYLVICNALTERDPETNERTYYNAAIPAVRFIPPVKLAI